MSGGPGIMADNGLAEAANQRADLTAQKQTLRWESAPGIFQQGLPLDLEHITAYLETFGGVELSSPTLERQSDGLYMYVASYTDSTGHEVSMGFVIPPDRVEQIVKLVALSLRDRR